MKILLIRPPNIIFKETNNSLTGVPLGIAYIAAVLKNKGYEVVIYDAAGFSIRNIREKILLENPDIIGISNQFSSQFEDTKLVAEVVKNIDKSYLVIVGGNHPSACPIDFFKKTNCVDIVVVGEGEYTMVKILDSISSNKSWADLKGIAFKHNDKIVINGRRDLIENLDELPYPAYELLDMENYFKMTNFSSGRPAFSYPYSERAVTFITSRGCPYNCIFCSVHSAMGNVWRAHSPRYIIEHLKFLVGKYNIKHIHFEDDNLTLDKDRFKKILGEILNADLKITWDTPNGVRADILDEETLIKSKKSGCIYLIISAESGKQSVLDNIIKKNLSLAEVEKVAALAKKVKLNLEIFFVIGFPGETIRDIKDTITFALKLQYKYWAFPTVFIATPLPGTRLYDICREKGYIKKDFSYNKIPWAILKNGIIETKDFRLEDIKILFRRFKIIRYMLLVINFLKFCFFSPVLFIKKMAYLFKIFFLADKKIKLNYKILLRDLIIYNFYIGQ